MNTTIKLKNTLGILLFALIVSFNKSCGTVSFGQKTDSLFLETKNSSITYDLKRPDEKYFLPYVLSEISGLSYREMGNLLTVDDETGKIFEYSLSKKKIVHSVEFSGAGDYEGIEVVDEKIYVLESDGDLFQFNYSDIKKQKATKIENALSHENDTEGLGYDPVSNSLLIVCKEKGEIDDNGAKGRSVYSFKIQNDELSKTPLFSIRKKDLKKFWEERKNREYDEKRIKFKPSAIAYHPVEKKYYVLASIGKLLVVVNRDGSIHATYPVSPGVLGQPEGLCFAPNGDMYISSEGEGDRGYILKYSMTRK